MKLVMAIWELSILFFLLWGIAKIFHNKKNFHFKSSGMGMGMAEVNADPKPLQAYYCLSRKYHTSTHRGRSFKLSTPIPTFLPGIMSSVEREAFC